MDAFLRIRSWGQSAGAISVSLQMLANGGNNEGLFRGAFMLSGSPMPVSDITHGQPFYDALVAETGCQGAADTLECLRQVPYNTLTNAINQSPSLLSYMVRVHSSLVMTRAADECLQALNFAWQPRVDGKLFTDDFQNLVSQGHVANIPFVTGVSVFHIACRR